MFESAHDSVVCDSCGTRHTDGVITDRQADGCAAEAGPDGVTAFYGSTHDDRAFAWAARPDWVQDGVLCDACLHRLLAAGALTERPMDDPRAGETPDPEPADGPVVCARCQTAYPNVITRESDQAADCAATASPAGVVAGYGSLFDTDRFDWVSRPADTPDGPLCDRCIDQLLEAGALRRVRDL